MDTIITSDIDFCAKLLTQNKVVAIPTETVYGLAANIYNEDALRQIFKIKGRPSNNPLIVHIHSLSQLEELTRKLPEKAVVLAKKFWPGPLSLVLPKSDKINSIISANLDTVAVRMPDHETTLALLKAVDKPIAAPSANPFTRISPTRSEHVFQYFNGQIPAILEGGPSHVGLESTIVGFFDGKIKLLRKGGISQEAIEEAIGKIEVSIDEDKIQAPGMHVKHYAPRTKLVLTNNVESALDSAQSKRIGVICFTPQKFNKKVNTLIVLSESKDIEEAARKLYGALHELDKEKLDVIIAERFPDEGLGASINDRLERAQR